MKALVLNNPFAWLIFNGKDLETRFRNTKVRGEILICSAKRPYNVDTIKTITGETNFKRIEKLWAAMDSPDDYMLNGHALGVVTLIRTRPMVKEDEHRSFVLYDPTRWCWELSNIRPIVPFEWKFGKQGWLNVPPSELAKIKYI